MDVDGNNDAAIAPTIAPNAPAIAPTNAPAIFRFDFAPNVVSKISEFAKLHMDDHRKEYKKAWEPWCEENKEMIAEEIRRLKQTGYDGDITDKMYKAGRYYFRKKSKKAKKEQLGQAAGQAAGAEQAAEQAAAGQAAAAEQAAGAGQAAAAGQVGGANVEVPKGKGNGNGKRMYIAVKSETLAYIDRHIKEHINDNDFSPKTGYDKFLKTSAEIVRTESEHLKRKFEMSDSDIKTKVKKTYKNRYYIITRTRD